MRMNIVIPTYQRTGLLERTLESIARARLPQSLEAIIVVENGERAGSEAVVQRFKDRLPVRYLFNEQPGRSRAVQTGVEQCLDGLAVRCRMIALTR